MYVNYPGFNKLKINNFVQNSEHHKNKIDTFEPQNEEQFV